jgi:hypothetical protein
VHVGGYAPRVGAYAPRVGGHYGVRGYRRGYYRGRGYYGGGYYGGWGVYGVAPYYGDDYGDGYDTCYILTAYGWVWVCN